MKNSLNDSSERLAVPKRSKIGKYIRAGVLGILLAPGSSLVAAYGCSKLSPELVEPNHVPDAGIPGKSAETLNSREWYDAPVNLKARDQEIMNAIGEKIGELLQVDEKDFALNVVYPKTFTYKGLKFRWEHAFQMDATTFTTHIRVYGPPGPNQFQFQHSFPMQRPNEKI